MKKFLNKRVKCTIVAGVLVVSMLASYGIVASRNASADGNSKTKVDSAVERLQAKRNETLSITNKKDDESDNEVVRAIITLKGKSVADSNDVSNYSSTLKSKEEKVIEKQETVIKKAEKITGNKVVNQSGYLVNSFSIDATRKQLKKIAKLDGVKEVNEAVKYKSTMDTAVIEGNAKAQWEAKNYGYTGEGVVVAVIDTGVNYKHKDMVLDEGVKKKYSKKQWEKKIKLLGYGEYFTEKVPFGYDYTKDVDEVLSGGNEHGYHVSGIVAANGEVVGVAKNAQIVGLKVLNDQGFGCSDDIVRGIEDAVKLGVDVINMSLGSLNAVVSDDDFEQAAINKASKEGIICCISAGNAGTSSTESIGNTNDLNMKDTTTLGSPVAATSSLGVASADNVKARTESTGTFKVNDENITVEYMDPFGYGFNIENAKLVDVGLGVDGNGKVTFKEKKVKDNVAIVTMGISTLNDKLYKVSKAGAKGIIVINKNNEINSATDITDWYGVPTIIVNETDGSKFTQVTANASMFKDTTFSIVSVANSKTTSSAVRMSFFSSWGPTNELGIKPEITAPGGNIKSTWSGNDKYKVCSGTSMSSPFVAGSEAVMINALRARKIDLKGEKLSKFLKNSMINTADVIIDPDTKYPYSVRNQGAGMVDVYGAVDNNVLATYKGEAKAELGELKGSKKFNITLTNYGKKTVKYNLKEAQIYTDNTVNNNLGEDNEEKVYNIVPVKGAKITFNTKEVTVNARSKATVTATVTIPSNYNNNSYVEAFISFEGKNAQNIGMPVLGFYGDWNAEPIIDTSVYDKNKGTSVIESANLGAESATMLGYNKDYDAKEIYGLEIEKKAVTDSEERNNNFEQKWRAQNVANDNGLYKKDKIDVSNAIKTKIGDTKELAIVNAGDSAVYKISSLKKNGFKIKFDDEETYNIAVYDKKLNFLDSNYETWGGYTTSPKYSMSVNSTYYVVVKSRTEDTVLTNINFVESNYNEGTDLIKLSKRRKRNNKIAQLRLNKTTKLNDNYDAYAMFKPKSDGYYTIGLEKIGSFNMGVYEYKLDENGSLIDGYELMNENSYKNIAREFKLYKDCMYIIKYEDKDRYNVEGNIAKVKVVNTDGSKAYTLENVYDRNKVAFSPNEDEVRDEVNIEASQLRNAKEISIKVINKNKEVVRTLFTGLDQLKQSYSEWLGGYGKKYGTFFDVVGWDGTIYNKKTGEYNVAKDGQYYIQIQSKLTKKSLPQVVTMPVKVDTVKPQLDKFEVSKIDNNTIVTFNIKDNSAVSPYYYIDIAEKVMYYGEEKTNNISLAKTYAETTVNESGDYVVNLGNIGESKITMLLEDQAGNQITKAINYDPASEEYVDIDMEDEDFDDFFDDFDEFFDDEEDEDEMEELCEGTCLLTKLDDGMFIDAKDDEIFIKGECIKGTQVEIEGYRTIYDEIEVNFGDVPIYEGSEYFYIHIPVSKDVTSYTLPLSVKRDGKELYNKTYKVNIDIDEPTITVLDNSLIDKVNKFNNDKTEVLLLKNMASNKFSYKIQISDSNLDGDSVDFSGWIESFDEDEDIETDDFIIEYEDEGNGVYNVTSNLQHCENVVEITAKDLSGKEVSKELHIFMAEDVELYNSGLDKYRFGIQVDDFELNNIVLDKAMLNKDGTYTINGVVAGVPDKLEINGKRVEVNPNTRRFKHNVLIKKGMTKVNIVMTVDGRTKGESYVYYYDEIKVKFNNLPKADSNGIITTNKQVFNLAGVISSYTSVASIELNGDNVYSTINCITSDNEKVFIKEFDYKIKLAKGKNVIRLKVVTGLGTEVYKFLTIQYK